MRILSIETSCDETAIAIIEVKVIKRPVLKVLANEVSSQIEIHRPYGGVYPSLAKREHIKNLPIVLKKALRLASLAQGKPYKKTNQADAIALTVGPGLDPCLWTGIEFAKKLAAQWNVPIIPVDHIEGHLLISLLSQKNVNNKFSLPNAKTTFPSIALIVSGGHTQLVLVKKIGDYEIIGETLDDAAGECFDKTARILGLPYPGGPAIAKLASKIHQKSAFSKPKLPRPMIYAKNYDFSFSGLKTAVLYDFQSRTKKIRESSEYIRTMAKEIQQATIDVLLAKTLRAAQEYNAKSIVLGGGVAANEELRKQLRYKIQDIRYKIQVFAAPPHLCTDNGLMIALTGYFRWLKKLYTKDYESIVSNPHLRLE